MDEAKTVRQQMKFTHNPEKAIMGERHGHSFCPVLSPPATLSAFSFALQNLQSKNYLAFYTLNVDFVVFIIIFTIAMNISVINRKKNRKASFMTKDRLSTLLNHFQIFLLYITIHC